MIGDVMENLESLEILWELNTPSLLVTLRVGEIPHLEFSACRLSIGSCRTSKFSYGVQFNQIRNMGFICQHTRRMILVNFGLVFGFPVWQNVNHLFILTDFFYSKRVQRLTTTCVRSPQSTDILYSFQYHNHLAIAPPVLAYDCFTSNFPQHVGT